MLTEHEFYEWERTSRDTIDLKRCYIDIAGDLVSGLLLSQIIYWFLPGEHGQKLRIEKEGTLWLAKGRVEWWDECRITPKQFDRAIQILKDGNLVETKRFRFKGSPTIHIWLNVPTLLERVNSNLTKGEKPILPEGELESTQESELEVAETSRSLTETTTETTPKTTAETNGKITYGQFSNVFLTTQEADRLIAKYGIAKMDEKVQNLSEYIQSKGITRYRDHYATILNWSRRDGDPGIAPDIPAAEPDQDPNADIVANLDAINEIFRKDLVNERDAQFLGGFQLESNVGASRNLYRVLQCLKGHASVNASTKAAWTQELTKLGVEV